MSEGKTVWQQTVGVPSGVNGAGGTRKFSLLSFRQSDATQLYIRVEDVEESVICTTTALGRVILGIEPDAQFDDSNTLHVMQVVGPKQFIYTHIGLNGEILSQENYTTLKYRPTLRRDASGRVAIVGGQRVADSQTATGGERIPNKLSDRPVQVPKQ